MEVLIRVYCVYVWKCYNETPFVQEIYAKTEKITCIFLTDLSTQIIGLLSLSLISVIFFPV
jgi:hypothetical protein